MDELRQVVVPREQVGKTVAKICFDFAGDWAGFVFTDGTYLFVTIDRGTVLDQPPWLSFVDTPTRAQMKAIRTQV